MGRRPLLVLALLACIAAVFPAAASAARARASAPVVKKISPKRVQIGKTITITGKNFVAGKRKNSVVFSNSKRSAVFVRVTSATRTKLRFRLPAKLSKLLGTKNGRAVPTRLRLRVISRRAGARLTPSKLSPVVLPAANTDDGSGGGGGKGGGGSTGPAPTGTGGGGGGGATACADDADLLATDVEVAIGTNPCLKDTDGDGMSDGWEYQSAIDLNNGADSLPYPGKRPYPNPLDGSDAANDFDGDYIHAIEEYQAFLKGTNSIPLFYSAGKQYSSTAASETTIAQGGTQANYLDIDADDQAHLSDDERDADKDGLSNWMEIRGWLTPEWWAGMYPTEVQYKDELEYAGVDFLDPDSDGDTRLDGADDQDYDGWTNANELRRVNPFGGDYFVRPFNPCLPNPDSLTCGRYVPFSNPWPPFNGCIPDADDDPPRADGEPMIWPRHQAGTVGVDPAPVCD